MRRGSLEAIVALLMVGPAGAAENAPTTGEAPTAIALPGGEGGIGFDDLGFSRSLGKVLVPAGRTGNLDLVDPGTGKVVSISGFSSLDDFTGGHDDGITSVAEGAGFLFVTDRTALRLSIVDPATRSIVGFTPLGASPDYVRWLKGPHELWVTEPDSERIEVFRLEGRKPPVATHVADIAVPGGPESLILDVRRGRAYTHVEAGTAALDLRTHTIVSTWTHGCGEPKGTALDAERGFLFVACEEGGVKVLDVTNGRPLGSADVGAGIDLISYDPELQHLYVPSSQTATLTVLGVSTQGALTQLGTLPATADSHCIAAAGKVYVGDPKRGRLLVVADPYPASTR